jgi:hypothetical protein
MTNNESDLRRKRVRRKETTKKNDDKCKKLLVLKLKVVLHYDVQSHGGEGGIGSLSNRNDNWKSKDSIT